MNWEVVCRIIAVLMTMLLVFQDFKDRLIYTVVLLCIIVVLPVIRIVQHGFGFFIHVQSVSILMLALIFASVFAFIYMKTKSLRIEAFMGLGDILYMFALSTYLLPKTLLIVFVLGSISGVIYAFVKGSKSGILDFKIPFAGILGVFFIILESIELVEILNKN